MEELKSFGLGLLIFGVFIFAMATIPMLIMRAGAIFVLLGSVYYVGEVLRGRDPFFNPKGK